MTSIGIVDGNLKLLEQINPPGEQSDVLSLRFSPDGHMLAIGYSNGYIRLYDTTNWSCLYTLVTDDLIGQQQSVTCIRFKQYEDSDRPEQKAILLATYASGSVKCWHYTSGTCLYVINEDRNILSVAYNPYGTHFVTSGSTPQLCMYDASTRKRLRTLESSDSRDVMNGHRTRVFTTQYHQTDPHIFLSGGWDDTVQFWDERAQHATKRIFGPHICGDALDIDPVHDHIITGSWRKHEVLQIWNYKTTKLIKDVPQDLNSSLLYCAQWLGRENIACGGGSSNTVRIIDRGTLNTVGQLTDLPAGVFCMDNDRQPHPKIAASTGSTVCILKMDKK